MPFEPFSSFIIQLNVVTTQLDAVTDLLDAVT
jgi:hypothetical protein